MKIVGSCLKCGICCQKLLIIHNGEIIKSLESFLKIRDIDPFYKNIIPLGLDSEGYYRFTCRYYKENLCIIYKNRPQICQHYPSVNMFKYGGTLFPTCGYKIHARRSFQYILNINKGKEL